MTKYKDGDIIEMGDNDYMPWDWGVRKGGLLNEEVMNRNLLDFKRVMDKHKINFTFIFGSALGLMREEHKPWAHPYDTDVDTMCDAKDHRNIWKVVADLEELGFFIPDKDTCPMRDHFISRDGEKIEIWWFEEIGQDYYYSSRVWYPKGYFSGGGTPIQYLGETWYVPHSPEEFVKITYGKNWKKPKPEGSYILKDK